MIKDNIQILFMCVLSALIGLLIGALLGENSGIKLMKQNAITHNVGHYNPTNATFEWNQ